MATPTGLRIVEIHNASRGATDPDQEWVRLVNEGAQRWDIRLWKLTDETDQQLRPHVYEFPDKLSSGGDWWFDPAEEIYVYTGVGEDHFHAAASGAPAQFHLYWDRRAMVWNNQGDRVYLRNADGTFVTVPYPIP